MTQRIALLPLVLIICLVAVMSPGCTTDQQPATEPTATVEPTVPAGEDSYATVLEPGTLASFIDRYPVGTLSAEEESDILFMQEEEKLARDVYAVFYETWGMQVFRNIGNAEQTHMDSVSVLVERYGLEPSSRINIPGEFANAELQALYDSLIDSGLQSPQDALRSAALVEETDIVDLQDALSRTDKADIGYVYENLMRGSENHLRAFVRNLEQQGESYTPKVLTEDEYEEIVSTPVRPGGFT
ncbi:hypothetical protein AZH53_06845 [Methanomicrobiaceae archaeon CYW5]|uniref:DUF2202 domain-containing protein n=1 Tax=Methanovulcanius yangii TaxID=1789227 RepID=UPI0029CAA917|nr:DUF2202 domain-containing protein [Methanovulcanius yangii]MBT8508121.1 hypothetical protein [Methanovulcanius yangii]